MVCRFDVDAFQLIDVKGLLVFADVSMYRIAPILTQFNLRIQMSSRVQLGTSSEGLY